MTEEQASPIAGNGPLAVEPFKSSSRSNPLLLFVPRVAGEETGEGFERLKRLERFER